jgi:hypothetical protein
MPEMIGREVAGKLRFRPEIASRGSSLRSCSWSTIQGRGAGASRFRRQGAPRDEDAAGTWTCSQTQGEPQGVNSAETEKGATTGQLSVRAFDPKSPLFSRQDKPETRGYKEVNETR